MAPEAVLSPHHHPSHGSLGGTGIAFPRTLPRDAPSPEDVALPPSARAILALVADGPVLYAHLVAQTGLPPRTVRWAVRRLRDRGLVEHRQSLTDGRRSFVYRRTAPAPARRTVL